VVLEDIFAERNATKSNTTATSSNNSTKELPNVEPSDNIDDKKDNTTTSKSEDGEPAVDTGPHLAWWHTVTDWLTTPVYPGVEESIAVIDKFIKENGPFDGLLGFSQGAVMAAVLSNTNQFNFKFVIICAAFVPSLTSFSVGDQFNTVPSLHLYGRNDTLVSPSYSKKLSTMFHDCISFEHKGGHFVPTDSDSKKIFREFFERFLK